ncbi:GNAT family N-acetyltransferase [Photobacterium sp. DNB23_23_1]|uniref:GNAT family N-acetyltransferase n=1 Tax=Photobacterium pectinilyticum TaxID=2906793 RepID=A0ABT1N131_9GAMM|nr:GNAT family N-acetyltransferase [Photobacterium sp. ZSDE20]MCQ1057822.1 GNAT family N-acetyltransferase [Photobacterium sp. ZSDE20]MDD1822266.1 GNAT family N-acetyltransferase [Photobacterium sp. ZSDE20]
MEFLRGSSSPPHPDPLNLALLTTAELAMLGITPSLPKQDWQLAIKPLSQLTKEVNCLDDDYHQVQAVIEENQMTASLNNQQHNRQSDDVSDVALEVYAQGEIVAVATFSRCLEDYKNPRKSTELFYELTLHSIYVKKAFRELGLATCLCELIINIARTDCDDLFRKLAQRSIQLKLWFSALAITQGGEAICDLLSESFVEMADDVIDDLIEEGVPVRYQEPMIFVDCLA